MDLATIIPTLTALLLALAAIYRSVSEDRRKNQDKEDARVDALTKGLQKQLDDALKRIDSLESGKAQRDDQIVQLREERAKDVLDYSKMTAEVTDLLQKQQESDKRQALMQKELDRLLQDNQKKDIVIHQQGEQIATLQTDNERLTRRVKLLEDALKQADVPLPNGEGDSK